MKVFKLVFLLSLPIPLYYPYCVSLSSFSQQIMHGHPRKVKGTRHKSSTMTCKSFPHIHLPIWPLLAIMTLACIGAMKSAIPELLLTHFSSKITRGHTEQENNIKVLTKEDQQPQPISFIHTKSHCKKIQTNHRKTPPSTCLSHHQFISTLFTTISNKASSTPIPHTDATREDHKEITTHNGERQENLKRKKKTPETQATSLQRNAQQSSIRPNHSCSKPTAVSF